MNIFLPKFKTNYNNSNNKYNVNSYQKSAGSIEIGMWKLLHHQKYNEKQKKWNKRHFQNNKKDTGKNYWEQEFHYIPQKIKHHNINNQKEYSKYCERSIIY